MMSCCCSLAGTNACLTCPNYTIQQWVVPKEYIEVPKKTKRIIEKFNEDGKLIERITEE